MKKINILITALFFVFSMTLFGQNSSGGKIYAAQGNDFVILRDGKRILYNADRLNDGPIDFLQGDIFQTGPQSSADIQFGDNGSLLKIVENSSIGFVGHGSEQPMLALNLFYGRIRVRNIDGGPAMQVSTKNGLVEVTQGDTGIDYIVRIDLATLQSGASSASPVLYVTNFTGKTNVFPANDGDAISTLPQLLVREGETVSVEFVSSLSYVERNAVESATANYWQVYDFAPVPVPPVMTADVPYSNVDTSPPSAGSTVETPLPNETVVSTNVEEIPYTLPSVNPEVETLIKRKNNALIATGLFFLGGLALGGVGLYHQYAGNANTGYFFTLSGMLVAGAGAAALIHGLTINLDG